MSKDFFSPEDCEQVILENAEDLAQWEEEAAYIKDDHWTQDKKKALWYELAYIVNEYLDLKGR